MLRNLVVFTVLSVGLSLPSFSQSTQPTIRATSPLVDIRVGSDYFAKGGWILQPDKDPDDFLIGSKWAYDSQNVTFITDIDSVGFYIKPGQTVSFIIRWNSRNCHIRAIASKNPIFLNKGTVLIVLLTFLISLLVGLGVSRKQNESVFIQTAYWSVVCFWLMNIIAAYNNKGYNFLKNTISELGEIGSRSELFTSISLTIISLLSFLFSIAFVRITKARRVSSVPAALSFFISLSFIWAATFPLGNAFHSLLGPLPVLTMVGDILAYFFWPKRKSYRFWRNLLLLSFFISIMLFLRFIPFGRQNEGLIQRFFYSGWTIWIFAATRYLSIIGKHDAYHGTTDGSRIDHLKEGN